MLNTVPAFLTGDDPVKTTFTGKSMDQPHPGKHDPEPLSAAEFIEAMRGAVTGVSIVTTNGAAGRFGVTVSAFSSVSADPPMMLACINRSSPVSAALAHNRCFAVNVLSTLQQSLADTFAGRPGRCAPYDFDAARWNASTTGAPVLSGAVAGLDCELIATVDAGTHRIFIGRVVCVAPSTKDPLLYNNRMYGRVGR
jgi:flavin reductase (DIM6/NTAB) family NADH-FMN oxidoreductase RutF